MVNYSDNRWVPLWARKSLVVIVSNQSIYILKSLLQPNNAVQFHLPSPLPYLSIFCSLHVTDIKFDIDRVWCPCCLVGVCVLGLNTPRTCIQTTLSQSHTTHTTPPPHYHHTTQTLLFNPVTLQWREGTPDISSFSSQDFFLSKMMSKHNLDTRESLLKLGVSTFL